MRSRQTEGEDEATLSFCLWFFSGHHRFNLKLLLDTIEELEAKGEKIGIRLLEVIKEDEELLKRLEEAPGISEITARYII